MHETPSGPAVKKLCERAYQLYSEREYCRLADISVAHLYNLRHSSTYRSQRIHYEKTHPKPSLIGERRGAHAPMAVRVIFASIPFIRAILTA